MEPTIREQVETLNTVAEMWIILERQFAGKSNKMHATRIMHELHNMKQGTKSVSEYAGEIKKLYRDLYYFHPFEPVDKKDLAIHKWFELFVIKLFLDGLHSKFDLRRQLIFSKPEWPSLDDVVSSVMEEETLLAHESGDNSRNVEAIAAISMKSFQRQDKSKLFCDHYKKKGYVKDKCFKLHGYPPRWQKEGPKLGGAQTKNWTQANHAIPAGGVLVVDPQALEKFQSKLKLAESSSPTEGSSKAVSSFCATSQEAWDRESTWNWDHA